MFHSAALKLTLWYLSIIMAISLVFSISLYRVYSADLGRTVNRQVGYFNDLLAPDQSFNYRQLRNRQLDQDIDHLKGSLIIFNLLVLAGGGAASYWLARRTLQPIEDALENQTRFASDASHELRTPLTAMITENEVALRNKGLTKSSAIDVIKSNLEEAVKLKALAEGLLRLSNNNGHLESPEPVSIKQAADDAVSRYQTAAGAKKINLDNKTRDYKVLGEYSSLVDLLAIFIDNSIKYSPNSGQVSLSSKKQGRYLAVTIADNGHGIEPANLPKIFDRFYRADNSRHKDSAGGYGLGLSIAKKITEAHHGHIEVSSAQGKGTNFTIFLPSA